MRVLAVSDIEEPVLYEETKQTKIGKVDLIISCGDVKLSYLSYLATVYQGLLFFVRGNHDKAVTGELQFGENLHNRFVNYQGIKFLGFEGSPVYSNEGVQYTDFSIGIQVKKAILKSLILGSPDCVITHAPPKGIHDQSDYAHRGTAAYTDLIKWLKPRFFLHGHTHLNYNRNAPRITQIGPTTVINVYGYYLFEI
jgi:Icc-related predicted phosphoesterase